MENKMAEESISPVVVVSSPVPAAVEIIKKVVKAKNPKAKPSHPNTADMVDAAIKTLAERNGSSLQAIKKYMAGTYKLDTTKHALFIKKYLKSAVTSGTLVQTKGKGANGSFKLAIKAEATKGKPKPKTTAAKKLGSPKSAAVKKPATKKTDAAKAKPKKETALKKAAVKKVSVEKKAAKPRVVKSKSPKAKKISKVPTAKPKAPKPKKAIAPKAKTVAQKV